MVKPADQKMIAVEQVVYYSQFPRGGQAMPQGAMWGSTRVDQEAGVRGNHGEKLLLWFPWEGVGDWLV